jgi:serine/threonine protein phosphatase PrpC
MKNFYITTLFHQGSGKQNEDQLLVNDPVFAVFDGATSLTPYTNEKGESGGYLASSIAKETCSTWNGSLKSRFIEANNRIDQAMHAAGIDTSDSVNRWGTSAVAVQIRENEVEWAQIGDSLLIVSYKDGSHRLFVEGYDHDQPTFEEWMRLKADGKQRITWEDVLPMIQNIRRQTNSTFGMLNGDPRAEQFIHSDTFPLTGVTDILLFTDGLFFPKENPLAEDDWDAFIAEYKQNGLDGVQEYVRSREIADSYCQKYPRLKQHDDIGAIAMSSPT